MSIINQALQKAQREQLVHSQQDIPSLLPVRLSPASRRRWLLLPLGLVTAVGVGVTLHAWFLPPVPLLPVRTVSVVQGEYVKAPHPNPLPEGRGAVKLAPLRPHSGGERAKTPSADTVAAEGKEESRAHQSEIPTSRAAVPSLSPAPWSVASAPTRSEPGSTPVMAVVPVPRVTPMPSLAEALPAAVQPQETLSSAVPPVAAPAPSETARAQALVQRAVAAQEAGELTRAISLLEQAVKLDSTAKAAYNSLGNVYYQQRRYQQAIAMYHKALAIDPEYAKARNNLGSTYMQLAMDERAIEELQKALQADRSSSLAYYNLACVYARGGDSGTAAQYLQQAIALEPQARTWAQTDTDFARVRTAPEVQQLLGP